MTKIPYLLKDFENLVPAKTTTKLIYTYRKRSFFNISLKLTTKKTKKNNN